MCTNVVQVTSCHAVLADFKITDNSIPVRAQKTVRLLRLPRLLVLHLCRFNYEPHGLVKYHDHVQFPLTLR